MVRKLVATGGPGVCHSYCTAVQIRSKNSVGEATEVSQSTIT